MRSVQQPHGQSSLADIEYLSGDGSVVTDYHLCIKAELVAEVPAMLGFHLANRSLQVRGKAGGVNRLPQDEICSVFRCLTGSGPIDQAKNYRRRFPRLPRIAEITSVPPAMPSQSMKNASK